LDANYIRVEKVSRIPVSGGLETSVVKYHPAGENPAKTPSSSLFILGFRQADFQVGCFDAVFTGSKHLPLTTIQSRPYIQ